MRNAIIALTLLSLSVPALARELSGAVFDAAGQPVSRARVQAFAPESSAERMKRVVSGTEKSPLVIDGRPASVETGPDGSFRLPVPADSMVHVVAKAAGFAPASTAAVPGEQILPITLSRAADVTGGVTAGTTRVSGAVVVWTGPNGVELIARTNGSGQYVMPDPAKWAHEVMVFHPDYAAVTRQPRTDARLEHRMAKGRAVTVRVLSAAGEPVASAVLTVDGVPAGTTGTDGTLRVTNVPADAPLITATVRDQAASIRATAAEQLEMRLEPERVIAGTVSLTTRGTKRPLPQARVTVQQIADVWTPPVVVVTDEKGRFTARAIAPGRYAVAAEESTSALRPENAGRMIEEESHIADVRTSRSKTVDLALEMLPRVTGRVTDHTGAAVSGASVAIVPAGTPVHHGPVDHPFVARTMPDGRYQLNLPPFEPQQRVDVTVTRAGWSPARSAVFRMDSIPASVDVRLQRTYVITGRMTDTTGRPIAGAKVGFTSADAGVESPEMSYLLAHEHFAVLTDARGAFTLHLVPGAYEIAAVAPGFQLMSLPSFAVSAADAEISLTLEPAVAIAGRVLRSGKGVEGVRVMIAGEGRRRFMDANAVTDATGAFRLTDLSPGTYRLALFKEEELVRLTVEAEAPANALEVELPPAGTLRGLVVDGRSSAPLTQFVLALESARAGERTRAGDLHRPFETTDGRFEITVPAGTYTLTAAATGYTHSEPREITVVEGEVREVQVSLDRGAVIRGRVTNDSGDALANAYVVFNEGDEIVGSTTSARPAMRTAPPAATTDENGSFTIEGIPPGEGILHVQRDGFIAYHERITVEPVTDVEVRLSRGAVLRGIVMHDGRPVEGAEIGAASSAVGAPHQSARSGSDGRFVLSGLLNAAYTVSAFKEGIGRRELKNVQVPAPSEIVIEIARPQRAVIFGRVSGLPARTQGKVVRRAVSAYSDDHGSEATIDEAGNYRIEDAPAGVVRIVAHLQTATRSGISAERTVEVPPGAEMRVDLDLSSGLTVSGVVSLRGRPLPDANVVFTAANGGTAMATTASDGRYEASLPNADLYRVFVHAMDLDARQYQSVHNIRDSMTLDIDIVEQTIAGSVVDASTGQPLAGARINLVPDEAALHYAGETISDGRGRFSIETAARGPHRVFASANGYQQQSRTVDLGSSTSHELSFSLEPGGELLVRVVDATNGAPLEANLFLTDAAGRQIPVTPQRRDDGRAWSWSLAPGTYLVTAIAGEYGAKTVSAVAPSSIEIALTSGGDLLLESRMALDGALRITDANGNPVLPCCDPSFRRYSGTGTRLRGLAPGDYRLTVVDARGEAIARAAATVRPGTVTRAILE